MYNVVVDIDIFPEGGKIMTMLEVMNEIVGVPPLGFEWMQYLFLGVIFIMFLKAILMFFSIPFKLMKL